MIITKYGVTYEQFELIPEEQGPEQLSLLFEFSELTADDLTLKQDTFNPNKES
jgi:hypothetical protein